MAATARSRARYADLAEGRGAGLVGGEERGGAYRLVSKSFGRGRGEYWRQVSSRYYGNFERSGGQEAHDVVKIAAVVHTLDPAWIDGNRPRHRHEDDHQGHQEPDQSDRTPHRRGYPYFPVLGRVNFHATVALHLATRCDSDPCLVPARRSPDHASSEAAILNGRIILDEDPFWPDGTADPSTLLLAVRSRGTSQGGYHDSREMSPLTRTREDSRRAVGPLLLLLMMGARAS